MTETALGPPHSLLFVGDSLTYYNDLDQQVLAFAQAGSAPSEAPRFAVDRAVEGGAPLKVLWKGEARKKIEAGNFDVVVLQEDLPETSIQAFHQHAAKFKTHCDAYRSKVVLLMTWPYERLKWIWTDGIAEEHRRAAQALDCAVAPAALAWEAAAKKPELLKVKLYGKDKEHPSMAGSYLTAAVVYATLWRRSPEGLGGFTAGLPAAVALELRKLAWETCQAWNQGSQPNPQTAPSTRASLVAAAFAALDTNRSESLDLMKMRPFAEFLLDDKTLLDDVWNEEYQGLCSQVGADPSKGISQEGFRTLVDQGSRSLLLSTHCSDEELQQLAEGVAAATFSSGTKASEPQLDRVIIVPGNGGGGDIRHCNWYGWLAKELKKVGIEASLRNMPDPVFAREDRWLPFIEKELAGGVDNLKKSVVVGHSSGAAAAMRLAEKRELGGMVLVAAYTSDLDDETERASGYFSRPWNWEAQKKNCGFAVQFASTDDPFLPIEEQREVGQQLQPLIDYKEFDGRSHFFDYPFPELLEVLTTKFGETSRAIHSSSKPAVAREGK